MANILIEHADIVTLDASGTILRDADLAIEGDRIIAVGKAPAGFQADETLDATNCVLMPGFYNAHTHAPMTFERGWAEDLPLDRWFNERVWVVEFAAHRRGRLLGRDAGHGGDDPRRHRGLCRPLFLHGSSGRGHRAGRPARAAGLVCLRRGTEHWHGPAGHGGLRTALAGRGRWAHPHGAWPAFTLYVRAGFPGAHCGSRRPAGRRHPHPPGRVAAAGTELDRQPTTARRSSCWRPTASSTFQLSPRIASPSARSTRKSSPAAR